MRESLPARQAALHALAQGDALRTLNFHMTPADRSGAYAQLLAAYARLFRGVSEGELEARFTARYQAAHHQTARQGGDRKPGLVVAFYNGYRNNYEVAAPLLERFGFVGWFFVPTAFVGAEPARQAEFAAGHDIDLRPDEYPDGRVAMTWSELRDLRRRGHVVASHSRTHRRETGLTDEALYREIVGSQEDFRRGLGHEVRAFAWVLGAEYGTNPRADGLLHRAGYRFLFSRYKVQRLG